MPRARNKGLVTILGESNDRCVFTGSQSDCFKVAFADGTFTGVTCWSALLKLIRRGSEAPAQRTTDGLRKQAGEPKQEVPDN